MSWQGIVKVQRPANGNEDCLRVFVYDQHRQHSTMIRSSMQQMQSLFPGEALTAFWRVCWPRVGDPEFLTVAPDQDW